MTFRRQTRNSSFMSAASARFNPRQSHVQRLPSKLRGMLLTDSVTRSMTTAEVNEHKRVVQASWKIAVAIATCAVVLAITFGETPSRFKHRYLNSWSALMAGDGTTQWPAWLAATMVVAIMAVVLVWWTSIRRAQLATRRLRQKLFSNVTSDDDSRFVRAWCRCSGPCRLRVWQGFKAATVCVFAVVLGTAPNFGFVYVQFSEAFTPGQKVGVMAALAIIKAALVGELLPWIAQRACQIYYKGRRAAASVHANAHCFLAVLLLHVNTIVVPVAAVLLLSPVCFSMWIWPPKPLSVVADVDVCKSWGTHCETNGGTCPCNPGDTCVAECATTTSVRDEITIKYPWRWDTECPSVVLRTYWQVYCSALLLQAYFFNGLRILNHARPWRACLRRLYDRVPVLQTFGTIRRLLLKGYPTPVGRLARVFNALELSVVCGTFDPRIAIAGALALVGHYLTERAMEKQWWAHTATGDHTGVGSLPVFGVAVMLIVFSCMTGFMLGAGDLTTPLEWGLGVLVAAIGITSLVVVERRVAAAVAQGSDGEQHLLQLSGEGPSSRRRDEGLGSATGAELTQSLVAEEHGPGRLVLAPAAAATSDEPFGGSSVLTSHEIAKRASQTMGLVLPEGSGGEGGEGAD